jgi:hypothetical protein
MPADPFRILLWTLEVVRPAFTRPGYCNLVLLLTGWVLVQGPHTVTGAIVAAGLAGVLHHERFHRFFSRGTWDPDEVGRRVIGALVPRLRGGPLPVVIDDTLAEHTGPRIAGLGCHVDAVRSTRALKVLSFGHCWVVLCVALPLPFARRPWALPVLFRLYRQEVECRRARRPYRKKTELAREMLDQVLAWYPTLRLDAMADQAYGNATVLAALSTRVRWFGAMRPDAVLTAAPGPRAAGQRGRPRKKGDRLPTPAALANDARTPWRTCRYTNHEQTYTARYKTLDAQWYRVGGVRLFRIVVVQADTGSLPIRVYFSSDVTLPVDAILAGARGRWSIEVWFRDAKQWLGLADSPARLEAAVLRVVPFVGLVYTTLVVWFVDAGLENDLELFPYRPWYPHKDQVSFADILHAARRTLDPRRVFVELCRSGNLLQFTPPAGFPAQEPLRKAG